MAKEILKSLALIMAMASSVLLMNGKAVAQAKQKGDEVPVSKVINYKVIVDDAYDLNHTWVHIIPIQAEAGRNSLNAGFGFEIAQFFGDNWLVKGGIKSAYGRRFDYISKAAERNAAIIYTPDRQTLQAPMTLTNSFRTFVSMNVGGTYFFHSSTQTAAAKMMLIHNKPKSIEPKEIDHVIIDCQRRRSYGARAGFTFETGTANLSAIQYHQKVDVKGNDGSTLKADGSTLTADNRPLPYEVNRLYSSQNLGMINLGIALLQAKNVAIKTDRYGNVANNIIVNAYADLLIAPYYSLDNLEMNVPNYARVTYDVSAFDVNRLGTRLGFEVFYNQEFHFAFGGEVGYKPGLAKQGAFANMKVSFPVWSFKPKAALTTNKFTGYSPQ